MGQVSTTWRVSVFGKCCDLDKMFMDKIPQTFYLLESCTVTVVAVMSVRHFLTPLLATEVVLK